MFFYCLFAVTILLSREVAVVILSAILFAFVMIPFTQPPWSVWGSSIIIEFVFGMWVALAYRANWRIDPLVSGVLAVAALSIAFYQEPRELGGYYPRAVAWGIPAFFVVSAIALSRVDFGKLRFLSPLVALGEASYALYLVHWLIQGVMVRTPRGYVYAVISVGLSIVAALSLNAIDRRARRMILSFGSVWGAGAIKPS
jgi:peptidoglycan/LPS O-acetylase OafA/YrhL